MQFIVNAKVRVRSVGIESNSETTRQVSHIVTASSGNHAEGILIDFYTQKSDTGPYGDRYDVMDTESFEPLSSDNIRSS